VISSSNLTKKFSFFEKSFFEKKLKKVLKKRLSFFAQPLITVFNSYPLLPPGI